MLADVDQPLAQRVGAGRVGDAAERERCHGADRRLGVVLDGRGERGAGRLDREQPEQVRRGHADRRLGVAEAARVDGDPLRHGLARGGGGVGQRLGVLVGRAGGEVRQQLEDRRQILLLVGLEQLDQERHRGGARRVHRALVPDRREQRVERALPLAGVIADERADQLRHVARLSVGVAQGLPVDRVEVDEHHRDHTPARSACLQPAAGRDRPLVGF
ncbi:hypothetical protein OV079_06055 [Nannocystis pusilla]|uniref:Uncharacterized protein n=1 Tax=Nannocystis pusilla TaxID=889268 RepID=A0A9X3IV85_9BACT|nr:hypothetical protein [Nannocystis pusilla]MCY1005141.1 hypothetical protein [Nannocystis pusilla]